MNMEILGTDFASAYTNITSAANEAATKPGSQASSIRASGSDSNIDVGGIVETGLGVAGKVLTSFFGYKTASLHAGQETPAGQTAYVPPVKQESDNNKTLLIVGGTALAAVVAIMALK